MPKLIHLLLLFAIALFGPLALFGQSESFKTLRDATFTAVVQQLEKTYYDADFADSEWQKVVEKARIQLLEASDMESVRRVIDELLLTFGESHIALLSGAADSEKEEKPWLGGWAGLDLTKSGKRFVAYRLDPEGPAYHAGLREGDTILSVGEMKVGDLKRRFKEMGQPSHLHDYLSLNAVASRFRGAPDSTLRLKVSSPRGKTRKLKLRLDAYEGELTEPFGNIGSVPLQVAVERLEGDVLYLRFNYWLPAAMPKVRAALLDAAKGCSGLIIDLRGNPGGVMFMAGGVAGLLVDEQVELGTTRLRQGQVNVVGFPQREAYLGPLAILVDLGSASTSEIFAVGLQEAGRARVFGERSAGAALPSVMVSLPNGDKLQLPMGDFATPSGVNVEGRGVLPDERVTISQVDLSQGKDTVIEAARNWILSAY